MIAKASLILTDEGTYLPVYSPDGFDESDATHRILQALCEVAKNSWGLREDEE